MFVLEAELWKLGLEEKLKCPILFPPSLGRISPSKIILHQPLPNLLLKTLFPPLHLFTAPSGQQMLCNVGQGAAGPGGWGVRAASCAAGMPPGRVQTHGADGLTVTDWCGQSNSVQSAAKQGARHSAFATSQSQLTASAVTRLHPQRTGKMGESRVQEHIEKQFAGYMWQLLDQKNK